MEITATTCPHGKPQSGHEYPIFLNDLPFCLDCLECRLDQIVDAEARNAKEEVLSVVLGDFPNPVLYIALKEKGY